MWALKFLPLATFTLVMVSGCCTAPPEAAAWAGTYAHTNSLLRVVLHLNRSGTYVSKFYLTRSLSPGEPEGLWERRHGEWKLAGTDIVLGPGRLGFLHYECKCAHPVISPLRPDSQHPDRLLIAPDLIQDGRHFVRVKD